jgi:preprotein translocase subunit YajC
MEKDDQRNLILALVLCFGLFMLYNMFVLEPQQKQAQEQAKQAQQNQMS